MLLCNKSSGFILIAVLILLLILAGVSLYSLTTIALLTKSSRHHWEWRLAQTAGMTRLHAIENQLLADEPVCLIPVMSTARLASRPIAWWQTHLCNGNNQSPYYYYGVEYLGNDSCAIMTNKLHDLLSAQAVYYRITLLIPQQAGQQAKILLQATVAKPIPITSICEGKLHQFTIGEQMLRLLT